MWGSKHQSAPVPTDPCLTEPQAPQPDVRAEGLSGKPAASVLRALLPTGKWERASGAGMLFLGGWGAKGSWRQAVSVAVACHTCHFCRSSSAVAPPEASSGDLSIPYLGASQTEMCGFPVGTLQIHLASWLLVGRRPSHLTRPGS